MTSVVGTRFGANLKTIRRQRGISQEDLAFMAGLHRTETGMLERGIRLPRINTFVKVCGSLDAKPNELLRGIVWVPGGLRPGGMRTIGEDEPPTSRGEDSERIDDEH